MKTRNLAKLRWLNAIIACAVLFSCDENQDDITMDVSNVMDKIPIALSSKILTVDLQSRSLTNQFENEDQLGFYVMTDNNDISQERFYNNELLKCKLGLLLPVNDLFYPSSATQCAFVAYYPYTSAGFLSNKDSIKISTVQDQTSAQCFRESDFMIANKKSITPSKNSVQLDFYHKLSKLDFVIKSVEGIDLSALLTNSSLAIDNIYTEAFYELKNNSFCKYSQLNSVTPHGVWELDNNTNRFLGKSAIVIPQSTSECYLVFIFKGIRYTSLLPTNLDLKSGNRYIINLAFDPSIGITQISSNIIDWNYDEQEYEANLEESDSNKLINISQLNFSNSSVMQISNKATNEILGELCHEYLSNNEMNEVAFVYYSKKAPQKGIILRPIDVNSVMIGDTLEWVNNTFLLAKGTPKRISNLAFNSSGELLTSIDITSPDVSMSPYILNDSRGIESIQYPIVKIGQQYWIRENFKATCYNDGEKISKGTLNSSNKNPFYFVDNGNYFYNIHVLNTNTITPIGWSIPSDLQWNLLKSYVGNSSPKLKSTEWSPTANSMIGNNVTGFNSKPIGIFSHNNSYQIYLSGSLTVMWKKNEAPLTANDQVVSITSKNDQLGIAAITDYCAYSIRLVKNRD